MTDAAFLCAEWNEPIDGKKLMIKEREEEQLQRQL